VVVIVAVLFLAYRRTSKGNKKPEEKKELEDIAA
jgi:hypothetical protein